jgi:hypothetical protein
MQHGVRKPGRKGIGPVMKIGIPKFDSAAEFTQIDVISSSDLFEVGKALRCPPPLPSRIQGRQKHSGKNSQQSDHTQEFDQRKKTAGIVHKKTFDYYVFKIRNNILPHRSKYKPPAQIFPILRMEDYLKITCC